MPGHKCFFFLVIPLSFSLLPNPVLAYVGPGSGLELIPYFLGLLAWAGVALGAVLMWPISMLFRRLRRARGDRKDEVRNEPMTANVPESPGEGSQDKP